MSVSFFYFTFAVLCPHSSSSALGLVLWGNTYSTYLAKLQHLENKAIRIIFNCNYQSPITPHFYKLGILKIADQYTFEVGKMMYQHSKQALPLCISLFFYPISSIHSRRIRSSSKKTCILQNSPFHDAKSLSNTKAQKFGILSPLTLEIKISINSKQTLKTHFSRNTEDNW